MANLTYAGIAFDVGMAGGGTHTMDVHEEAVYSADGTDYLFHRYTISALGTVNPSSIALAANGLLAPGTAAGLTLQRMAELVLGRPRMPLTFTMGPDRIINSPGISDSTNAPFVADPENGPIPEVVRIQRVEGIKTAWIEFRVRCAVRSQTNILLSNRFTITHSIDELHYTVRSISGVAVLRADMAIENDVRIDDFRRDLFIDCPDNFRRTGVHVVASSDGLTLNYEITDTEQPLNAGPKFPGLVISGNATTGWQNNIKQTIEAAERSVVSTGIGFLFGDFGGLNFNIPKFINDLAVNAIPRFESNVICRIHGNRNSNKLNLAALALQICMDRFSVRIGKPPWNIFNWARQLFPVSCYLTQDLVHRFVELRMEFLPLPTNPVEALLPSGVIRGGNCMNLDSDILTQDFGPIGRGLPNQGGNNENVPLPNSGNSRGTYVGRMVEQSFNDIGKAPSPPPIDEGAVNVPLQ